MSGFGQHGDPLRHLAEFGDRPACLDGTTRKTFADLAATAEEAASVLESAAPPRRAVVAIEARHSLDALAAILACHRTRSVALPIPPEIPESERCVRLRTGSADGILSGSSGAFAYSPFPDAGPRDAPAFDRLAERDAAGLILFSSGSTGRPKAMLHDLGALLARFAHLRPREERTLLLLLPDHIGGLDSAFRCLFGGSSIVLPEARTPEAAGAAIQQHRATVLPASPTFLNLMLMEKIPERFDCASLRVIAYGAETMPPALLDRLAAAFPNADLQQKFGTSETGAVRIKSTARDSLFFSVADPDTEWKIVDGELWLKTPARILGYLNTDDTGLEADGWYRTGDFAEPGPGGTLRIIGRKDTVINVGGRKVHPAEVEAALAETPGIAACRVFANEDPLLGQTVACEIVPSGESPPLGWKRHLRRHLSGRLPPWKQPAKVSLRDRIDIGARLKQTPSQDPQDPADPA